MTTSHPTAAAVPAPRQPRGNWPAVVGLLFALVAMANVGCKNVDPTRQVLMAQQSATAIGETANDLYAARLITKRDMLAVTDAITDRVNPVLDTLFVVAARMSDATERGEPVDLTDEEQFGQFLQDVRTVVRDLTQALSDAKARKANDRSRVGGDRERVPEGGGPDRGGGAGQAPADGGGDRTGAGARVGPPEAHRRAA